MVRKMIASNRLRPTGPASIDVLFAQVNTRFQLNPIASVGSRYPVGYFPWYY